MRKVLITGASDGIGRSIALRLSNDGYKVILCGRDKRKLSGVARECSNDTQILAFDLNNTDERNKALSQVKDIDILINNAGIWHKVGGLETISEETITNVINTNLTSQILITKALLPSLKDRKESAIINIISKSGVTAQSGQSVYSASKWGMKGFTDTLRNDTSSNKIRIGAIYQSGINMKMFEKAGEDFPTNAFTEPGDLAEVVVFMLSRPKKLWIKEIHIEK